MNKCANVFLVNYLVWRNGVIDKLMASPSEIKTKVDFCCLKITVISGMSQKPL